MKTKKHFLTAAITTALVSMAAVAPAKAASFGTDGIMFNEDTTIEFDFGESGGLFRSDLAVYELDADGNPMVSSGYNIFSEVQAHDAGNGNKWIKNSQGEWVYNPDWADLNMNAPIGSCGITVLDCTTQFTFEAGKQYTLGLFSYHRTSGSLKTISYSDTELASMREGGADTNGQLFLFGSWGSPTDTKAFANANDYAEGYSILNGMEDLLIGIDDSGNKDDADYNDFKIIARKLDVASTPEPTVLLGLGVVAGGMFLTRRNKNKAS
jgi:hypothetical protein